MAENDFWPKMPDESVYTLRANNLLKSLYLAPFPRLKCHCISKDGQQNWKENDF